MRGARVVLAAPRDLQDEEFAERGRDIEGDILVTLEEALRGSVRTVNVRHNVGRSVKTETHRSKSRPA